MALCSFGRSAPALAAASLCLGLSAPALAQSSPPSPPSASSAASAVPNDTALTLGSVVIRSDSGPLEARSVFSSVTVVPSERVETQMGTYNWQLFEVSPGVMLTEFNQGTTSGKLSMRGFNGEGEINAVKLLIDGVPGNSNDGNMPYIDVVPRLDIESLEVVRGTNDPRWGLHNIAGNVNIATRRGGNDRVLRLGAGSFGTRDAQAALGIESDGMTQNYALGWQQTQGHRAHSAAEQLALSGKWFVPTDGGGHVGLIARGYDGHAQEAGYLTAAQRTTDPWQSPAHNASDEDRRRTTQLALQAQTSLGDGLTLNTQLHRNGLDDRRFVRFSVAASQQERYTAESQLGASAVLTWRVGPTAWGPLTLVTGIDTERQDNTSERYSTSNQVRTAQTRDQHFFFNTQGGFVQALWQPVAGLTLTPALRVDRITGHYTNALNGNTYPVNDYGTITSPKFGALYALAPRWSVYGNAGRSFQVGVGTAAYKVNQSQDLAPSVNDGWELGLKYRDAARFEARAALWRQTASNEARRKLNDPSNDSENIGRTRREGIDLEANAQFTAASKAWASVAWQRSRILQADAGSPGTEGREIDHVPRQIVGLGVEQRLGAATRASAWLTHQGSYFLERTNSTGRFGGSTLIHASLNHQVDARNSIELQVRNLANRYHEYVWWDGTQSLHAPGAPRSVYLSWLARL